MTKTVSESSKISAIVITAGLRGAEILQATIQSVAWADEIIVVDKCIEINRVRFMLPNIDNINLRFCNWSPTVEATRGEAVAFALHPWIIMLDDDEILSPDCETVFNNCIQFVEADVFAIPIKHYILGQHDPRAAYWPEYRPCFFKKGSVEYSSTVHSGIQILGRVMTLSSRECWIDHLSHENISAWIEKTNRYTDQKNRSGQQATIPLGDWATKILTNKLLEVTKIRPGDEYLEANATLHAIYEIVDGLKHWEAASLPDGAKEFHRIATEVMERHKQ